MKEGLKLASRAMQAGMLGLALSGILTGDLTYVPAAAAALFISVLPSILNRDLRLVLPVELNFWIILALFVHIVGSFSRWYDTVPGWDHITHALSASLIAALGFVVVVAIDKYADSIYLPRTFLALFILMFTVAIGVIWELMEFMIDELTGSYLQYSLEDSMRDLMFDTIGGALVALAGTYYLTHTKMEHFVEGLNLPEARKRVGQLIDKDRGRM